MNTTNLDLLTIGLAVFVGLIVLSFIFGISRVFSGRKRSSQLQDIIQSITKSELELERADADLPDTKTWSGYWQALATKAGVEFQSNSSPGLLAIGLPIALAAAGFLVWPGGVLGAVAGTIMGVFFLWAYFQSKIKARMLMLDRQLPNLIAGIRANLQSGSTPQRAIMNQASEIPAPLGNELKKLNRDIELGVSLDNALQNFGMSVPSREVAFLVSAMRIAIASGADLDPLMETMQTIIVQRARIAAHLSAAVAQAQPAIWVTGIMIPAGYLFSFTMSDTNQAFWVSPMGIICTIVVAIAYGTGLFLVKKQVDKVKKA